MITAYLRFCPAFDIGTLDDPSPRHLVVQRGALVPLSITEPTPVVIDHDEDKVIGRVKRIDIWPDVHSGIVRDWYHASVELDDPPNPAHYRKYGPGHRALRAQWARRVAAGGVECARCGELIDPRASWDLGHVDGELAYSGPEHARCNRAMASHRVEREGGWIRIRGSGEPTT